MTLICAIPHFPYVLFIIASDFYLEYTLNSNNNISMS
jgi:hypothetical protein